MADSLDKNGIPKTDSIRELARFWDTNDVTDFESELEEVDDPVFRRRNEVTIALSPEEATAISHLAHSQGIGTVALVRKWVVERIQKR